jgi:hypothetical protein
MADSKASFGSISSFVKDGRSCFDVLRDGISYDACIHQAADDDGSHEEYKQIAKQDQVH